MFPISNNSVKKIPPWSPSIVLGSNEHVKKEEFAGGGGRAIRDFKNQNNTRKFDIKALCALKIGLLSVVCLIEKKLYQHHWPGLIH